MKKLTKGHFINRMIFVSILTVAIWAAFNYIPDLSSEEKQYEIDDADIAVQLQKDGSLLVHEELDFDFTGQFSGAYRDIPLNGGARIKDLVVSEDGRDYDPGGNTALGSYDRSGTFGTETFGGTSDFNGAGDTTDGGRYVRVVWHYNAIDEKRTFDITYRVTGAANVRDDLVDVTWTIWGDQWDFWLNSLDARMTAESGVAPTRTWLRPRSLGVDPEISEDYAEADVDRVPEGEAVGMRAVFPRDAITSTRGAEVDPGDGLAEIEAQEAKLDDELSTTDELRIFAAENDLLLTVLLALLGMAALGALVFFARERPTDVPEYLPEPPEDIPPAFGYQLASEGKYDERLVLATLMDLIDRGYYETKASQGKDLDLMVRVAEADRPNTNVLEKYEVSVMDFFDRLLGVKWVAIGKMKDEVPKHSSVWRSRWENMNEKLDDAETSHLNWDRDLSAWRAVLTLAMVGLFVILIVLVFQQTNRVPIPAAGLVFTVGLLISAPTIWLKRLAIGPRRRSAQWQAFENWTRDFPRLKDDPPATLELWRRILVYAVAFGTAERIAKSGRIPAPVLEQADGFWAGHAVNSGFYAGSFNSFGSGFSSQVAPQSSSGGGGGFSGGGGGGFSGGGGGGAW